MKRIFPTIVLLFAFFLTACHFGKNAVGTSENPIKFYLVPSKDANILLMNSKILKDYLEQNTPYKFEFTIPNSFSAVVQALGEKSADIAAINTYGYYLAHSQYAVEARLTMIRNGLATYQSQFLVRADSKIKSINDLHGKKIAFVDPASTSGYLMPLKTLKDKKIEPKEIKWALKHDAVVEMVYKGEVDAGATYYSPSQKMEVDSIREKLKIIEISDPIPNDPIVFRRDIPEEMKEKIVDTLLQFVTSPEGQKAIGSMFGATNFKKTSDADYETIREMVKVLSPKTK
ncbi:MAG: phosphate/phosphite/phosphonate ABC transporter substrate-binding protein [Bdellovibrio sp.]